MKHTKVRMSISGIGFFKSLYYRWKISRAINKILKNVGEDKFTDVLLNRLEANGYGYEYIGEGHIKIFKKI